MARRRHGGREIGGGDGLRPDHAIHRDPLAHVVEEPLEEAHRVGACIHIHVKHGRPQFARQAIDARAAVVMLEEDLARSVASVTP